MKMNELNHYSTLLVQPAAVYTKKEKNVFYRTQKKGKKLFHSTQKEEKCFFTVHKKRKKVFLQYTKKVNYFSIKLQGVTFCGTSYPKI